VTMARDAESTRRRIFSVALALFREKGYAKTTMRAVAKEAGLSLGAAYHHFDSKQAIVAAYYAQQTEAHEAAARAAMKEAKDLRERLGFVMHTALDVRGADRELMRELAPLVVSAEETLSAFSDESEGLRARSIGVFREAVDDPSVPEDVREVFALALWGLMMGLLLYFSRDESPRQRKTRALVDGALDLAVQVVRALALPMLAPMRAQLKKTLADADLLP